MESPKRVHALIHIVVCILALGVGPAASYGDEILSLMTYNIHVGIPVGYSSRNYVSTEKDLRNIADVITSSGADIVAIQEAHCEFGQFSPKGRWTSALNQPRLLAGFTDLRYAFGSTLDDLPSYPENRSYREWGTADQWTNNGSRHGEFGNAILARFKSEGEWESLSLPNHPGKEFRGCVKYRLRTPTSNVPVTVYATHLQHDSAPLREEQAQAMIKFAAAEPSGTVVFIMGDLNDQAAGPTDSLSGYFSRAGYHDLHRTYCDAKGKAIKNTFPADKPDGRIDYIFCNQPLEVEEADVIQVPYSDHLPLLIRVKLPKVSQGPR